MWLGCSILGFNDLSRSIKCIPMFIYTNIIALDHICMYVWFMYVFVCCEEVWWFLQADYSSNQCKRNNLFYTPFFIKLCCSTSQTIVLKFVTESIRIFNVLVFSTLSLQVFIQYTHGAYFNILIDRTCNNLLHSFGTLILITIYLKPGITYIYIVASA